MTTLNKEAAEAITGYAGITTGRVGTDAFVRPVEQSSTAPSHPAATTQPITVHAMTDITGFGLIGHLRNPPRLKRLRHTISREIPILEGALDCIHAGHIPGGLKNNREFAECLVEYDPDVPHDVRTLLYDPQTAGGLLICTPEGESLTKALHEAGVPGVQIGEVQADAKPRIRIGL